LTSKLLTLNDFALSWVGTWQGQGTKEEAVAPTLEPPMRVSLFCFDDLHVMMYERDPHPLNVVSQTKNELSTSRLSTVIVLRT